MKINVLITATATNKQECEFNRESFLSMCDQETDHLVDVMIDTRVHEGSQTEKVNEWLNFWKGKDYEWLLLMTNDSIAHPLAIEYMVKAVTEDPTIDLLTAVFNRDKEEFYRPTIVNSEEYSRPVYGRQLDYKSPYEFNPNETGSFFMKKGIIENIGVWNPMFPHEYNERDFLCRMRFNNYNIKTLPVKIFYHPPQSQVNSVGRQGIDIARANYTDLHGGDWMNEKR